MSESEYKYNVVVNDQILIHENFKQKGKEYGIVKLNRKQIEALIESIDLISRSPQLSPKFAEMIEGYLLPRFEEITQILYDIKSLPSELGIEISKENHKDISHGHKYASVDSGLEKKGFKLEDLKDVMKNIKFVKHK